MISALNNLICAVLIISFIGYFIICFLDWCLSENGLSFLGNIWVIFILILLFLGLGNMMFMWLNKIIQWDWLNENHWIVSFTLGLAMCALAIVGIGLLITKVKIMLRKIRDQ